jgi:hypothetical protein
VVLKNIRDEVKIITMYHEEGDAVDIVLENQVYDTEWTYTVVPMKDGFAISVYDEDLEFLGYL